MPMSASLHDDNDSANKLANPLPRAFPQGRRSAALVQRGMRPENVLSSKRGDFRPKGAQVRGHRSSSAISLLRAQPVPVELPSAREKTARPDSEAGPWSLWTHPKLQGVFERKLHCPLPPWTEALSLVNAFFEQDHMALPIFHPPAFIALLGQQYSEESEKRPAWWTAFNAVLAISHRRRVEEGASTDKELMWSYAANALDTVLDILLRATQLMSVQALLTLAWFFLGTPNPQPSFMLVANAIRLAHSIGLHRKNCGTSLSPLERATRINVFWLAFSLDRELSLRTGRPPAQDFGDFDVDLPDLQLQPDFTNSSSMPASSKVFSAGTRLAVIQAKLYSEIYLSEGLEPVDIKRKTTDLHRDLEEWRLSFALCLNLQRYPELTKQASVLRLNYTYYHTVILVHRAQSDMEWRRSSNPEGPRTPSSKSIERSLEAARSILKIASFVPGTWKSFLWDVIPINVTAIIVLSLHLRRRPGASTAIDDLDLICEGVRRLMSLEHEETESYLRPVTTACLGVYNAAIKAVRLHVNGPAENLDIEPERSVTVLNGTEADSERRTTSLRNSCQTTPRRATSPFRFEPEPDLVTNAQPPVLDTNFISWDQTMTDREIVPWEFEYLLGDNSFDSLG
ncbi:Fusaridione A cluster transcription factor fsdR [Colletotrichum aenigma]|uniref:Fusaridione A cluster transcription factor fsdR n=1 Tax=Colletotrichum aenigma TaxID=1215731 RepID=UPI0018724ED1|nr:Fusaridione A cluster transcription factor fsdR [Colletotrichum aenigma]KAF5517565.1 Fusaridione A cluster transcription factor fsdR [Colletotrichum aenigma]